MVFALIPVVLVVVVVVVLMARKGGKSAAAEPTEWPTPESNRPGPSKFSEMSENRTAPAAPLVPTPRPTKAPAAPAVSPGADAGPRKADVAPSPAAPAPAAAATEPVATEPVAAAPVAVPAPAAEPETAPAPASASTVTPTDDEDDVVVEEPDLSRFGIPSERKVVVAPQMPKAQVRHLEQPPLADVEPAAEPEVEPEVEPDPVVVDEFEPVVVTEPLGADPVVVPGDPVLEFEEETLSLEFDDPATGDLDLDEPAADEAPASSAPPIDLAAIDEAPEGSEQVDGEQEAVEDDAEVVDVARVDAEAELDRVIGALIDRARATDQSVVEVATELVERANLDEKEATDTLATLMDGDDTTDIIDIAGRLSELTLFNEAVPSKPGALTQFGDLDPLTRKRVIVRVLCLLVAKSESDLKALPKNPASAAETRQWPLARAVWPVAAKKSGAQDADLPNRDFGVRR